MQYKVREEILSMKRYVAGKPISEVKRELGLDTVVKMASNENPMGASPKVKEAIERTLLDISLYPDSGSYSLREELSKRTGRPMAEIFIGGGSDSLIKVISSTFLKKGDEIIMGAHSFSRYEDNALLMGATVVKTSMEDLTIELDAMEKAITEKTKIIYLCNPNNPTGSSFGKEAFEGFIAKVPKDVMIIVDEAYREYVTREDYFDATGYLDAYKNLIVLRTFSKAYGMASLRVGYGFANEELAGYFYRVVDPFDVNLFAQEAAVAALKDEAFLGEVVAENTKGKEFFYKELEAMGLPYVVTDANFILWDTKRDDMDIFHRLMKKGYIIRPGGFLGIPGHIRVSISTMENNHGFMKAYKEVLQEMDEA
ncbi:MAG TPA: histidinol-phosphate transaminase [Clostridiaceae bacterium]|nr:histidinol-phosphate transaminase [Clostridiaceae bacterium]